MQPDDIYKMLQTHSPFGGINFNFEDKNFSVENSSTSISITNSEENLIHFHTKKPNLYFCIEQETHSLHCFVKKSFAENSKLQRRYQDELLLVEEAINENFFSDEYTLEDAQRERKECLKQLRAIDTVLPKLKKVSAQEVITVRFLDEKDESV